jgi:polar amino acid transport system permease protein
MQLIYDWFRELYESTGINLVFIYESFGRARMIKGFWLTIYLSFVTMALSIVIGIIGAWLKGARSLLVRYGVDGFISLFRNTPPLVQIYFFYFGLGFLLPRVYSLASGAMIPLVSNIQWAILSLSLFAGAFNIEIFRSGAEAVPHSMIEAAESLGYTRGQIYLSIVLPLALRNCLPALGNNLVNLVKTTNLAYAIAVPELMYVSREIWSDAGNVPEMMIFLLLVYVGLVALLVAGLNWLERALQIPGYGQLGGH